MNGILNWGKRGFSPFTNQWSLTPLLLLAALLLPLTEARAAVAYGAAGTVAIGTTTLSVPHPAGIVAGHLLVLVVGNKFSPTNPPSTPAGWTLAGQGAGGLGNTTTNDEGPVFSTIFVKEAVGGETGNLAVTLTGANSSMGRMFRYTKAVGTSWNYAATSGSDNTVNAAWSVTGAANPGITAGDMLIVGSAANTDGYTFSAESVAAAGATLVTNPERQDSGTVNGRDLRLVVSDHTVTLGTATAAPLFTMTASGTTTNRPTGASVILRIREVLVPTTTLDTGSDPLAGNIIAPDALATDVNQFTLQTSSGTEAITSVTVNLSTNSGVGLLSITSDNGLVVLGSTASPVAGANIITVAGLNATTALTAFKVRVTPLGHALPMPAPPGAAYAITATVTAWVGPNTHAGSDTNPNALTIDNLSPASATLTNGSAGTGSVTLGWTTSVSADFNTTGGSVLYRWTTTAGAEVPVEGSAPAVNSTNGAATVACVLSSAASTLLSGIIDGTGGSAGCNTSALNPGTAYVYKIFQKDTRGNYDTGVTIGTFTTTYPVPTTTSISPTSKPLGAATFTLTVNGTNFTPGSIVQFAGSARTTTYVSPTQLTATIPDTDLTVVGTFNITVFNPTPGGGTSTPPLIFTVTPAPPSAVTNAATGVTSAVATLNGTVGSNGDSTTVSFEYGLTIAYGSSIAATQSPLAAGSPPYPTAAVSAQVIGLNCNTVFHYRVVATNSAGTTNGLDGTFTTGSCSAPFPATACAATRFNGDLGCTANDVNITGITLAPSSISSCVSGNTVSLDLDLTVNFAVPDRWDVGIFIANDGNLPTLLPANGGASSCSVAVLPIVPETGSYTFPDLDGAPQGTADTCGDGNGSIDDSAFPGGTVPLGDGVKRMTGVTMPCYASPASGGKLFVPFAVSWDNQKSPTGSLCTSNLYPVPNTTSKCNAPASTVSINVVVLPVITKTNGGTEINPGANTTYTVVIHNNSGGTLLDMVFTDPVVANLTVNSVGCAAAGGAICPAMTSAAMIAAMQGTGIPIPSTSLPNNSTLTFTINATVSPGAGIGSTITNTATATLIGGGNTSVSDVDTVVLAPSAAMSFSPSTITEGATSVLTITLTNPIASPVTGVSFTDTYPSGVVNTANASTTYSNSCGGTVTAANNGNSLVLSGGTIPANGSCTVTVNVTSATVGSYSNSTGTVTHDTGTIAAASAILTVNAAVYGGFNACDVAAIPNASCTNTTTLTTSHITTKIAGSSFNLDLVALKTDGTRQTNYNNKIVLVELLDASNNSGALDAYNCRSTWTSVIATLSPNPEFVSNGLLTVGPFTIAEAWRDVRVRVTNVGGTTKKGCSTDNFAIRPASFTLIGQDTNAETAGTVRTLNIVDVSSGPVHKAGRPFSFTATAYNAALTPVPTTNYVNNPGHPTMTLSDCTPAGTACTPSFGTFTPGVTSFTSGTLFSNVATYSEVGSFNLTLQDTDFASVDAADTPATCDNSPTIGRYVCGSAAMGRFVPDHFAITPASPVPGCGTVFTYFGQDGFTTDFTITAQNAGNQTVTKYEGVWAKLPLTAWGAAPASAGSPGFGFAAATLPAWSTLSASATTPVGSWTAGVGTFTVPPKHQASRPSPAATPVAPTTIAITALPVDADGVTMPAAAALGNALLRFGILRLDNAYGSELLPIRVPVRAMYCNAVTGTNCTEWRTNTDDACTALASTMGGLATYAGSLATSNFRLPPATPLTDPNTGTGTTGNWMTASSTLLGSGTGTLVLNKPCIGGPGAACTAATGSADLTFTVPTWLRGTWTSSGTWNENPRVRLKFGSPKAPYIYLRERY